MITHVVVFTWKPDVTAQQVVALKAAIDSMLSQIGGLHAFHHGPDLRIRPGNGDYVLSATFADEPAWHAYQGNPAHKELVREFVAPLRASSVAVQFAT